MRMARTTTEQSPVSHLYFHGGVQLAQRQQQQHPPAQSKKMIEPMAASLGETLFFHLWCVYIQ